MPIEEDFTASTAANGVRDTYLQLTKAEAAASRMEQMLDAIESKMAQLEQLQADMEDTTATASTSVTCSISTQQFRKLDGELQQLEQDLQALQTETGL
ncbi:hypothetical protein C6P40_004220 [Pichia californica]|uniref:Uncharacterized protein n=1 Tax=Pichia californica TaxID=460514 RepID=A0A9P6WPT0_9ASCO|nr:hypothetical protein C6P42_002811 [[Candida] californica]KAG0689923.1 hypothetical protein C6P40_004220 [[Candida] californica]